MAQPTFQLAALPSGGALWDQVIDGPVLALDVVGYSKMDVEQQQQAQLLIGRLVAESANLAGPYILARHWVDAGDGGYVLIQGDMRAGHAVLKNIVELLGRENGQRRAVRRVHLRFVLHYGASRVFGTAEAPRVASDTVNNAARLLAGMDRSLHGQVVCSGYYRKRLVEDGGESPKLFTRLPDIIDKRQKRHVAWNMHQPLSFGVEVKKAE